MTRPRRDRKSRPTPATSSPGQCKARGPCWVASPRRGAATSRSRCRSSSEPATNSYRRWTPIPVRHQAPTTTEPATRRRRRRAVPQGAPTFSRRDREALRRLEVLVVAESRARERAYGAAGVRKQRRGAGLGEKVSARWVLFVAARRVKQPCLCRGRFVCARAGSLIGLRRESPVAPGSAAGSATERHSPQRHAVCAPGFMCVRFSSVLLSVGGVVTCWWGVDGAAPCVAVAHTGCGRP